jgi:hypothetical protein
MCKKVILEKKTYHIILRIMKGGDIGMTIMIFIIFILLFLFNILSAGINNIKKNWPEYRCNPMMMPFAKELGNMDPNENFTYCVQNMQANYMGTILQPVNHSLNMVGNLAGNLGTGINSIRHMFDFMRQSFGGIMGNIYDTFLNIIVEFQKSMISMNDMVNKVVGLMQTLMMTMEATTNSMKSGWNGIPGSMLQALGCFDPDTKVQLNNNTFLKMKDLHLGDILKNGSKVDGIMIYNNIDSSGNYIQPFYEIPNGENNETVLCTGSHLVWDGDKFNYSKNHPKAKLSEKKSRVFCCLCTSDNIIQLGDNKFWDYNDTEEMRKDLIY